MSRGLPKIGDVLITTEAPLGNIALIDREDIALAQRVIKYRANPSQLSGSFLNHFMMSPVFQTFLDLEATGGTVRGIKGSRLHRLPIALPPLPEQKAIAGVLESWDKGIRNLELKIEKKRLIKNGLLQRLLSGKQRFKGFTKVWKSVRLGDVASVNDKALGQNTEDNYDFYYIDLSCIKEGTITLPSNKIKFKNAPSRARRIFKRNDVLMATVRPNLLGHCYVDFDSEDKICSTGFAVVSGQQGMLDNRFFYAHLFGDKLNTDIQNLLTGSSYPSINSTDVENLSFDLPPLDEQQAIAQVLSAADDEIEALEKKLALWKDQKNFLLNNLVTGTMRLPQFCVQETTKQETQPN